MNKFKLIENKPLLFFYLYSGKENLSETHIKSRVIVGRAKYVAHVDIQV